MFIVRVATIVLIVGGCSGGDEPENRSNPVVASQQIGQQSVGELHAPDVNGAGPLFVRGTPALPGALRMIQIGMDSASARAAVELVRDPEVPLFESTADGAELLGGQLPGLDGVGFTVIIRGSSVAEIDVSIPAEGARERLVGLWGKGRVEDSDGLLSVVWDGAPPLRVKLFELDDDKSVVKFLKQAN